MDQATKWLDTSLKTDLILFYVTTQFCSDLVQFCTLTEPGGSWVSFHSKHQKEQFGKMSSLNRILWEEVDSHLNYCRLNYGTFELLYVWTIVHFEEQDNQGGVVETHYPSRVLGYVSIDGKTQILETFSANLTALWLPTCCSILMVDKLTDLWLPTWLTKLAGRQTDWLVVSRSTRTQFRPLLGPLFYCSIIQLQAKLVPNLLTIYTFINRKNKIKTLKMVLKIVSKMLLKMMILV